MEDSKRECKIKEDELKDMSEKSQKYVREKEDMENEICALQTELSTKNEELQERCTNMETIKVSSNLQNTV